MDPVNVLAKFEVQNRNWIHSILLHNDLDQNLLCVAFHWFRLSCHSYVNLYVGTLVFFRCDINFAQFVNSVGRCRNFFLQELSNSYCCTNSFQGFQGTRKAP